MKNVHWPFVVVLVLAVVSVDAAVARATWGLRFPHPAIAGLLALGLAQLGLIAAWLATGTGNIVLRVSLSLLAMVVFSWLLSSSTQPDFTQWLGVLGLYATVVAVPIFIFHWVVVGRSTSDRAVDSPEPGELADGEHNLAADQPDDAELRQSPRSPPQWTLAGIMSLITVVAVALGYGRMVDFPQAEAALAAISCIGFALTTLISLFIAYGINRTRWHVPAVVLTCPPIGAVVGLMLGTAMYAGVMAVVALIQSLVLVLLIDLFRMPQRVPPQP